MNKFDIDWMRVLAFVFVVFFLGFMLAPSGETEVIEKEVIREVEITPEPQPTPDLTDWRRLKEVDDRGFKLAGEVAYACSNAMDAVGTGDAEMFIAAEEAITSVVPRINAVAEERLTILERLGY